MGVIAWIAVAMHVDYILFPGLGALAHDVIKRPHGTWAKAPGMLVLTPLLTGLGILILRLFDLHVPPALAVGLLPFVVPVVDCRFAVAVGIGTLSLNMLFLVWRRLRKHVSHRLNGEAEPVEYVHLWMASCVMPPNAFDMFSATGPQLSAPWRDARYFGSL